MVVSLIEDSENNERYQAEVKQYFTIIATAVSNKNHESVKLV